MFIVGKVLKPQGIKGELKVEIITSFPEHFSKLKEVYTDEKGSSSLLVEKTRSGKDFVFIKFKNVDTRDAAEQFRGCYLYIPEDKLLPLAEDEYYCHQLIGFKVFSEDEMYIGELEDIESYSANDVYVLINENKEKILIPAVKEIIKNVDLETRKITIHVIDGLLN